MFSVFNVTGRLVSGTLEQLRDVAPVRAAARIRPVTGQHALLQHSDAEHAFLHLSPSVAGGQTDAQAAMAAYAKTQATRPRKQPLTRVSEVMSTALTTVRDDTPLSEAWSALAERGVGQAPVLNGQGLLVGLLLQADMMQGAALPHPGTAPTDWLAMWRKPVSDLMLTPVPSVSSDAELRRVAQALLDWQLPGLPVADEAGVVVGFISRGDILRAVAADPPLDLWG